LQTTWFSPTGAGDPTVIVLNKTAVASNPAAGPGVLRRTLLTDENVEAAGIRFDRLTLPADASFRFEPSARSMVWFQVLEGEAKLKTVYTDGLSDRHSVFLPPAFDATLSTERRQGFWRRLIHQEDARGVSLLRAELPNAARFEPEVSTKQPLFTVLDWTREPVLQSKNDGRKRVPLVTAETCQTTAIKVQMVIYPPVRNRRPTAMWARSRSFIF
jgi:hypothetical protein